MGLQCGFAMSIPAVSTLRQMWMQQYYVEGEAIRWRTEVEGLPPARQFISSPYDLDARLARKETTCWVGYKVHLTESCDEREPHPITHVETTPGPVADGAVTPKVHRALQGKDPLPSMQLVDTGYLDARLLVTTRREYGVDLEGLTRLDYRWQARVGKGFDRANFQIDWEKSEATCPEGRKCLSWTPAVDNRANEVIKIKFSMRDCQPCPSRAHCTRPVQRTNTVRGQEQYLALVAARGREKSGEFAAAYAKRAGID